MIITIDGPAASGKSTVARALAKKLGYFYLYSGILFRALAYLLVNKKGYTKDGLSEVDPADVEFCLDPARFSYQYDDQRCERVLFDGEDITPHLKDSYIDDITALIAVDASVRTVVMREQHRIAYQNNVISEGRDMGTVVFPDADIKFYLTADLPVRAQRWRGLQEERGNSMRLEEAVERITIRDTRDTERKLSPLKIPDGAIVIDNTDMNAEETLEAMLERLST